MVENLTLDAKKFMGEADLVPLKNLMVCGLQVGQSSTMEDENVIVRV
jgi:hypothetical protein